MDKNKEFRGYSKPALTNTLIRETVRDVDVKNKNRNDAIDDLKEKLTVQGVSDTEINRAIKDVNNKIKNINDVDFNLGNDKNDFVENSRKKQIVYDAIQKIESNKDPEDVVLEAENKLKRLRLSEKETNKYLQMIFDHFDNLEAKQGETEQLLSMDNENFIPLPMVDLDYDTPNFNLNLKKDDGDILPSIEKNFGDYDNLGMKKSPEEVKKFNNELMETGDVFVETEELQDFIKQVKLVVITIPTVVEKVNMEDVLKRYFFALREDRFSNIISFGWESEKKDDLNYRNFDKLLEYNNLYNGALFIIRDIKTFNVYASQVLRPPTRNFFIVFIDGLTVVKEDLVVIENLSTDVSFLWPTYSDLIVVSRLTKDYSYIDGEHLNQYNQLLVKNYNLEELEEDRSYEETNKLLRDCLCVYLDKTVQNLGNPGLSTIDAAERAPKFRNLIYAILSNHDKRILVKLREGKYGIETFTYLWNKFNKKLNAPIVILDKSESIDNKRKKVNEMPENGPVLVITNYALTGDLIPKNLDMYFISGGGSFIDFNTIGSIYKGINYPKGVYPRYFKIVNFITKLKDDITESIDDVDFGNFYSKYNIMQKNLEKLRSHSFEISVKGTKLIVKKAAGLEQ